jgi:hypothetical protein
LGFLDALIGGRRKLKGPAADRLFAMVTAQVGLETELGLKHRDVAAIVFQPLATGDFDQIVRDTEELLRSAATDTGTKIDTADDEFGYRWIILRDPDFEDLVVSLNTISTELQAGGYGDRLLAAVFPFERKDRNASRRIYFIYNYKRGTFYPFVPADGDKQRDSERELQLKAQLEKELPMEPEITRWFPLWEIPL